jgi:hypothetical protein
MSRNSQKERDGAALGSRKESKAGEGGGGALTALRSNDLNLKKGVEYKPETERGGIN